VINAVELHEMFDLQIDGTIKVERLVLNALATASPVLSLIPVGAGSAEKCAWRFFASPFATANLRSEKSIYF
jgi:hypothetical protein